MSRWLQRALWLLICAAASVQGHEVRPGYLEVTQSADDAIRIVWRQPVAGAYGTPLVPKISTGWLDRAPQHGVHTDAFYEREWRIAAPHAALAGAQIKVDGLERTITDVLVRVAYADGTELTQLLKPAAPSFIIPNPQKVAPPVREYLELGFTHIWSGIDHLLYVFGLMLLVGNTRTLIRTITGFTVAHSISLGAAALGYVHVPAAPVEAVIALSIVYVAVEILHARQGRTSIAQRAPWAVAFCFGLLHGLGFAGALSEVGLPGARHSDGPAALQHRHRDRSADLHRHAVARSEGAAEFRAPRHAAPAMAAAVCDRLAGLVLAVRAHSRLPLKTHD